MSTMPLPLTKLREINLKKRQTTITLLKRRFPVDFLRSNFIFSKLEKSQSLLIEAQAASFPWNLQNFVYDFSRVGLLDRCGAAAPLRFSFYISHKVSIKHSNFVDLLFPLVPFSSLFFALPHFYNYFPGKLEGQSEFNVASKRKMNANPQPPLTFTHQAFLSSFVAHFVIGYCKPIKIPLMNRGQNFWA